jgi:hypothetical protein
MKKYKCIKEVHAFKIVKMTGKYGELEPITLHGADGCAVTLPKGYVVKHQPEIGGYYVRYKDGYESYSPQKAFEEGYKEI